MTPASRFWGRILRLFFRPNEPLSPLRTEEDVDGLIRFGQRIHCLETLDWLKNRHPSLCRLPEPLLRASKHQRLLTLFANRRYEALMDALLDRSGGGLDLCFLKGGGFLHTEGYPPGLRRLSDLDLLVRWEQLPRWHDHFVSLGFEPFRDPEWTLEGDRHGVSVALYRGEWQGTSLTLDVHWHLIDSPERRAAGPWNFSMEPFWKRSRRNVLCPEHRFVYLVDHAFTHGFRCWKGFMDLAQLHRQHSLNVQYLESEIRRMNAEREVGIAEIALRRITGLSRIFPAKLFRRKPAERWVHGWGGRMFLERILRGEARIADYVRSSVASCPGWTQRMRFLRDFLFPPVPAFRGLRTRPRALRLIPLYARRAREVLGVLGRHLWTGSA